MLFVPGLLKQATAVLDNLVKEKGPHAEINEHAVKVVMSMAEIVFKVVAIGLQGLEGFVLDFPARSPGTHDRLHVGFIKREISNP